MSRAGIYRIVNTVNGKQYIGSSVDVLGRFRRHRFCLRNGTHHSRHLQRAWNKHGEAAFVFELLWSAGPSLEEQLYEEQLALNYLRSEYNCSGTAVASRGRAVTAETRRKMSISLTGRRVSATTREKLGALARGRVWSKAQRANASLGQEDKKKPVVSVHITTGEVALYPSLGAAARAVSVHAGNISACLRGRRRTTYGYRWRYASEEEIQALRSAAIAV